MALQSTEGSQSNNAPPPFLTKTYDMVDDPATDLIVSWSSNNNSFVVWNHSEFARDLLPKYFKHNNFSSFVRQLNTYGFRKVDPDRWEFANEGFIRGQRHLLKNIHRRKPSSSHNHSHQQQQAQGSTLGCVELGKFGLDGEIERLKRDKNVLMMELVRLRQQQQATERELQTLGSRLQAMEQRQQQMMAFLAKAMQNPGFLAQIVQQNENNIRLAAANKKRRLPKQEAEKDAEESNVSKGQIIKYQPAHNDTTLSLMQLMNSEMVSKADMPTTSLESFLQELAHFPGERLEGSNSGSRTSGVTLTEMNPPSMFPETLVNEISSQSNLELPDSPIMFPEAEQVGDTGCRDLDDSEYLGPKQADSTEPREVKVEPMVLDLNLSEGAKFSSDNEISTNGDCGSLVPNVNDRFWEQFLTESPDGSSDTDAEVGTEIPENNIHVQECLGGLWWSSKAHVDQLVEQMGQLVSASKP